jgi:hypothetical protein
MNSLRAIVVFRLQRTLPDHRRTAKAGIEIVPSGIKHERQNLAS